MEHSILVFSVNDFTRFLCTAYIVCLMLSFGMCMCLLLSGFVFIFEELVYFVHALGE